MKRLTTTICCIAMMFVAISAAFMDYNPPGNKTMMAATIPQLSWNPVSNNKLPLDLQLDLDKRLSYETPTSKDTIIMSDTVFIDKIKWKTRYKTISARTEARNVGEHLTAVTPDSLPDVPIIISTPNREEEIGDFVGDPKSPSIQLTVDGVVVYQSEDETNSTEESQ